MVGSSPDFRCALGSFPTLTSLASCAMKLARRIRLLLARVETENSKRSSELEEVNDEKGVVSTTGSLERVTGEEAGTESENAWELSTRRRRHPYIVGSPRAQSRRRVLGTGCIQECGLPVGGRGARASLPLSPPACAPVLCRRGFHALEIEEVQMGARAESSLSRAAEPGGIATSSRPWKGVEVCSSAVLADEAGSRAPVPFACQGGRNLAGPEDFQAQAQLAARACGWYRHYVSLLRRLSSGHTPVAVVGFCGQGGTSEGIRRAGGASHGQDICEQAGYVNRFGAECFSVGDSSDASALLDLRKRTKSFLTFSSPTCKADSPTRVRGVAQEEALVGATRDACRVAGGLFVIENVVGARLDMRHQGCQLRGAYFGLHVDCPRLFEANFELRVDEALVRPGLELKRRTCLGARSRDALGRPLLVDCCAGNLWAAQGDEPLRCTVGECAAAMGVDVDHMDYEGLSKAIPPAYGEYVFGQAAMREVERKFGLKAITFDDYLADPGRSERMMSHWLRGAGGTSPNQGVELCDATEGAARQSGEASGGSKGATGPADALGQQGPVVPLPPPSVAPEYRPKYVEGAESPVAAPTEATVLEAEARELFYTWAGDYDAVSGPSGWWAAMSAVKSVSRVSWGSALASLSGRNTLIFPPPGQLERVVERLRAVVRSARGTRITVRAVRASEETLLKASGFRLVRRLRKAAPEYATESRSAGLGQAGSFWSLGDRGSSVLQEVDYERAEAAMDPRDRPGAESEPPSAKAARSYMPIPWEKERWDIGLPKELDEIMARHGVGIYPWEEVKPMEVPFYRWASQEGLLRSIAEADRALLAGAMEYVPADRIAEVLESSTIHPWTIVDQGGGKWRLCHDYSVGINRVVPTVAFSMTSVWDVRACVKPSSHFAKYDIRDGFWHVPIADDSKKRLVVRHPGTGKLLWATRLPFGYLEAPRIFCALTEAVVARLRKKAAGLGINFFVFVDDILCVGDDEALTRLGMEMLEEEFSARGIQWAPHKRRGPCQCIEFLGLLLCNVDGLRGITISRKRRDKLVRLLDEWGGREPVEGSLQANPRELASFLGLLVFVSQVVQGGRTYMQGMLSQFKGLVVDWQRGKVRPSSGEWSSLEVSPAFWRDLRWWREHLDLRSLTPFEDGDQMAEAVLTGTDASNWGTGQVLWLDGAREESALAFTNAERRRPINWRELLGIVRVCEVGGDRLRGKTVLLETDNMAAKGAASKGASKAADMQELVRRLLSLSEKHGFRLRVTHTPGSKLDRPDQTSRGDAVEESRFRLREPEFGRLSRKYGPFTSFIGSEREYSQVEAESLSLGATRRLWVHPTSSTVGSALRRVQETLGRHAGEKVTALALVPADGSPAWAKILKHGLVVGAYEGGSECLAAHALSGWQDCTNRRPLALVLFPRAAGARVKCMVEPGGGKRLAGNVGSFVYALPKDPKFSGSLCQIHSDDGVRLIVAYWALDLSTAATKVARDHVFCREVNSKAEFWEADPREMWSVDHLVGPAVATPAGRIVRRSFDMRAANAEIERAGGKWVDHEDWEVGSQMSAPDVSWPGFDFGSPSSETKGEEVEDLVDVANELSDLFEQQHLSNRGSEGRVQEREMRVRGGVAEAPPAVCQQRCQYAGGGMTCDGCREPFRLGELMESRGSGLVHPATVCRELADVRGVVEAARGPSGAPTFYGLYSEAIGISGVFSKLEEVMAAIEAEGADAPFSSFERFESHETALSYIHRTTMERASEFEIASRVKGSASKRNHLSEKLSDSRLSMIDACIEGRCGVPHGMGSTRCKGGCGRQLHMETCAQMGRGFAALGNFLCVECRVKKIADGGVLAAPTPEMERVLKRTMVLELNQGQEATAAGYADYQQLEERYALGLGLILEGEALRLPRHNVESFKNFLTWMALDADRSRSIESIMRTAGSMMVKLGITDVTKSGEVKAHARDLLDGVCMEHESATTATPAMLKWCIEKGIDERYFGFVAKREKVQFLCEGLGGCRIGEVCGGGETHGILANNLAFLEDASSQDGLTRAVVELKIEHSKTKFSRYMNMAATTGTSGIKTGAVFMDYCKVAGFTMTSTLQAGVRVVRPDFWVVRVSLLGLNEARLNCLLIDLERGSREFPGLAHHLDSTRIDAKRRHFASGAMSQEKKYVNVMSGDSKDERLDRLIQYLESRGWQAAKVPGPLLLSTTGGRQQKPKLMPLSASTASAPTKELLTKAWQAGFIRGVNHDADLDLPPDVPPRWSTHSLRRLADTVARRYREAMNVTVDQIDIYFGWHEKILLKAMQVYYSSLSIRERMLHARITGMM